MSAARFRLAPMSALFRWLTWGLLPLPLALAWATFVAPGWVRLALAASTLLVLITYASVWFLFRPSYFEVDAESLVLVWPLRASTIPRASIEAIEILDYREIRRRYGVAMRIGAGGLWGAFGLLKTTTQTLVMYISRFDGLVLVTRRGARPLLLTPEHPENFAEALRGEG
jgi:hypothetical protein